MVVHENFTDVDGVFNIDPRLAKEASLLTHLGYNQCRAMAVGGASVLHPDSVVPLQERNVPIWVRNSFGKDESVLTCVHDKEVIGGSPVLAMCVKPESCDSYCVTFVCKEGVEGPMVEQLIQELTRVVELIGVEGVSWDRRNGSFSATVLSVGNCMDRVMEKCFEHLFP